MAGELDDVITGYCLNFYGNVDGKCGKKSHEFSPSYGVSLYVRRAPTSPQQSRDSP